MVVFGISKCLASKLISASLASPSWALAWKQTVSSPGVFWMIFDCDEPGLTWTKYFAIYFYYIILMLKSQLFDCFTMQRTAKASHLFHEPVGVAPEVATPRRKALSVPFGVALQKRP